MLLRLLRTRDLIVELVNHVRIQRKDDVDLGKSDAGESGCKTFWSESLAISFIAFVLLATEIIFKCVEVPAVRFAKRLRAVKWLNPFLSASSFQVPTQLDYLQPQTKD